MQAADVAPAVVGVPGVEHAGWVPEEGYTGTNPAGQIEAYLWNIRLDSVDTAV